MPPRKRKAGGESVALAESTSVTTNDSIVDVVTKRLKAIDAAVEERCEAIMAAADEAASNLIQQVKTKLLGLPKKVRSMKYKDYLKANPEPSAAADAAAAAVDSKLEQMQLQSEAAATAAPTTRTTRSRARAGAMEPATVRVTRARQPVPKFIAAPEPAAPAVAAAEPAEATACAMSAAPPQEPTTAAVEGTPSRALVASTPSPAAMKPAALQATANTQVAGNTDNSSASDARRAAAQAKVDAKLAAIGVAASTAARAGGRTAMRAAQPGEQAYSRNGSPLSLHPNITRARGRGAGGWALMTPAMQAAAQGAAGSNGSMVGCFTLVKKHGNAAAAAAGTSRAGRSRAATAAGRSAAATGANEDGDTAMVIMTDDGSSFAVDATAGGLSAVPASHREEVAAKLRAIQQLAAKALGAA